jgi:hypothetical protein
MRLLFSEWRTQLQPIVVVSVEVLVDEVVAVVAAEVVEAAVVAVEAEEVVERKKRNGSQ